MRGELLIIAFNKVTVFCALTIRGTSDSITHIADQSQKLKIIDYLVVRKKKIVSGQVHI